VAKSNQVDPSTIRNILTLRYDPNQQSSLPVLTWKDFTPTNTASCEMIEKYMGDYLQAKIEHFGIKKITLALSSGIDSILVLTLLKKKFPDIIIDTLSIKFANSVDESEKATKICEHFGIDHKIIFLENFLVELPKMIDIVKLPFWDLHWYYVAKEARNRSQFLAAGDGGDELFGGYTFRYSKFLSLITKNSSPETKIQAYLSCHERDTVPDHERLFGPECRFSWNSIYEQLMRYFDNELDPIEQVFLADYNGKLLYNFSLVNSRINKNFAIEYLTPILSNDLINYSCRLEPRQKYDETTNVGKIPLRNLLKKFGTDIFVSDRKQGFSVDTLNLWKSHGMDLCNHFLSDSRAAKAGIINQEWIAKYVKKDDLDVRYVNKFLGLLALEIWYRLLVTKEMKSNELLN